MGSVVATERSAMRTSHVRPCRFAWLAGLIAFGVSCWLGGAAAEGTVPAPLKAPAPRPYVEVLAEKPKISKPAEPVPINRDPFEEQIARLVSAGAITAPEAEWLQASLKRGKGDAEKTLAERLLFVESVTLGQWRARTTYDYSLPEEVFVNPSRKALIEEAI